MNLYFTRHGESEANTLGIISNRGLTYGLTDVGRQQAIALAARLKEVRFARIYSSPLLRAIQTAEILARELDLTGLENLSGLVEITDALREYDCGILEGQPFAPYLDDYLRLFRDWTTGQWDRRFESGESLLDIQARFMPFIERIAREHGEADDLLLVSHGGILLGVLPILLKNVDHTFANEHMYFGNTDVVVVESTPDGWMCRSWCGINF
jgi:broad specificity phosphatase PhoE